VVTKLKVTLSLLLLFKADIQVVSDRELGLWEQIQYFLHNDHPHFYSDVAVFLLECNIFQIPVYLNISETFVYFIDHDLVIKFISGYIAIPTIHLLFWDIEWA
jgi:hypothetical protein